MKNWETNKLNGFGYIRQIGKFDKTGFISGRHWFYY